MWFPAIRANICRLVRIPVSFTRTQLSSFITVFRLKRYVSLIEILSTLLAEYALITHLTRRSSTAAYKIYSQSLSTTWNQGLNILCAPRAKVRGSLSQENPIQSKGGLFSGAPHACTIGGTSEVSLTAFLACTTEQLATTSLAPPSPLTVTKSFPIKDLMESILLLDTVRKLLSHTILLCWLWSFSFLKVAVAHFSS